MAQNCHNSKIEALKKLYKFLISDFLQATKQYLQKAFLFFEKPKNFCNFGNIQLPETIQIQIKME